MKTIREMVSLCTEYLEKRGIERARREAEDLLSDALGMPRVELYMKHDRPLVESELALCRERLARRGKGEPLAYIHGEVDFLGCRLVLNQHVLIPRQETAQLIDRVVNRLQSCPSPGILWDLCCGSGCIGIALKRCLPGWAVFLSDVSEHALQIARQNAERNGVEVTFRQGDLLEPFTGERAHAVVCNPPYLSEADYGELGAEVRDHEPRLALVSGPTGYEFYERLARQLPSHLQSRSPVWFEIGDGQGDRVSQLFVGSPWARGEVYKDWSGRDRFFSLESE